MGGGFNPLSIVSDAMNALKDVGQTLEDLGSGNIGQLGQDLGKDFGDITKLGTDVASFTNPELAPFLQMAQPLLQGLAGQAGGFSPQQICANPSPFGMGGFNPGVLSNPFGALQNIFGGGSGGSGASGASGPNSQLANVNSWGSSASAAVGGESWNQLQSDLQNAQNSGDPAKIAQVQQKMNMYMQMVEMLSQAAKAQHDSITQIVRNISA